MSWSSWFITHIWHLWDPAPVQVLQLISRENRCQQLEFQSDLSHQSPPMFSLAVHASEFIHQTDKKHPEFSEIPSSWISLKHGLRRQKNSFPSLKEGGFPPLEIKYIYTYIILKIYFIAPVWWFFKAQKIRKNRILLKINSVRISSSF